MEKATIAESHPMEFPDDDPFRYVDPVLLSMIMKASDASLTHEDRSNPAPMYVSGEESFRGMI